MNAEAGSGDRVVGHGAHRLSEACAHDQPAQQKHNSNREPQNRQLQEGNRNQADFKNLNGKNIKGEARNLGAENALGEIDQHNRGADARNQGGQVGRMAGAQRLEGHTIQ